jgi:glycine/D-amino acid oxidase-like deaminating enzyme
MQPVGATRHRRDGRASIILEYMLASASSTVVLGGGIIGSSIAYHLSLRGEPCTVIEQQPAVATAASGKAAGFLGESWGDGKVTERLHRESFAMHEALSETLALSSFRQLSALKVDLLEHDEKAEDPLVGWLDGGGARLLDESSAQVDPHEMCTALMAAAVASGHCTLRTGEECVDILTSPVDDEASSGRAATGVLLASGEEISCDRLVVALGPWSCLVEEWLGVPMPVEGIWSTSIIYEAASPAATALAAEPRALFCSEDSRGCHLEVYPRPDGEVYVAGCGGSRIVTPEALRAGELPPAATNVPDESRVAAAERSLADLSSAFQGASSRSTRQQACMRPMAPDGLPILGPLPGVDNLVMATGHGPWGVLWAPITGRVVSELLLDDGEASLNVRAFQPRRFDTLTYRTLMKQRGREKGGERVGEQW